MGSKRPEQIHKDLLATDSKTRTDDEHIHEEDKQLLHTRRGKLAIPEREEVQVLVAGDELAERRRANPQLHLCSVLEELGSSAHTHG